MWILCDKNCIANFVKQLKSYVFGEILSTNCMKQIPSNQKLWYYKTIFSLRTPMLSPKLSFIRAKDRVNLYIITAALFTLCQMTQCIVLKVQCFYLWRSKGPLVLLSTKDKTIVIKFHENQRLNLGNQYKKTLRS